MYLFLFPDSSKTKFNFIYSGPSHYCHNIVEGFYNTVQCDSIIHFYVYMFRSSYDHLQKAQQLVEETTITLVKVYHVESKFFMKI
jgi:hypothetical protein